MREGGTKSIRGFESHSFFKTFFMTGLFEEPMPLDKVNDFLQKPTDISVEAFHKLLWLLGIDSIKFFMRMFVQDSLFDCIVDIGFMESKGDIRRMIKNNGIKLSGKPLTDKFVVTDDCWFSVEGSKIKFIVLQKGKKDFDLLFKVI